MQTSECYCRFDPKILLLPVAAIRPPAARVWPSRTLAFGLVLGLGALQAENALLRRDLDREAVTAIVDPNLARQP
jgi:hypothetical protein